MTSRMRGCDEPRDEFVELEVVHYPLNTVGEAIVADSDWRVRAQEFKDFLASTTTSNWDRRMAEQLARELANDGVDIDAVDDRELALAASKRLMERSEFEDGFTTFLADYKGKQAIIPRKLKARAREDSQKTGRSVQEQWERELFADGMFEHKVARLVHLECDLSVWRFCAQAGLPTRIVLVVPLVDANDPFEIAMIEHNIRHHRVRATILKGIRPLIGSWASHTFNEVLVGGRWRRLNYTRLGQPTLDSGLFGLTTHILTLRDWAEARMGQTVGMRQGPPQLRRRIRQREPVPHGRAPGMSSASTPRSRTRPSRRSASIPSPSPRPTSPLRKRGRATSSQPASTSRTIAFTSSWSPA